MNATGKLEIIAIEPDDDGLDPAWLRLPDQEKWEQVRQFMMRGIKFEQRFKNPEISLRVLRNQGVFEGLPHSQAHLKIKLQP